MLNKGYLFELLSNICWKTSNILNGQTETFPSIFHFEREFPKKEQWFLRVKRFRSTGTETFGDALSMAPTRAQPALTEWWEDQGKLPFTSTVQWYMCRQQFGSFLQEVRQGVSPSPGLINKDRDFASILSRNPVTFLSFCQCRHGSLASANTHSKAFPCGAFFLGLKANKLSSVLLSPQVISTQMLLRVPPPFEFSFMTPSLFFPVHENNFV